MFRLAVLWAWGGRFMLRRRAGDYGSTRMSGARERRILGQDIAIREAGRSTTVPRSEDL